MFKCKGKRIDINPNAFLEIWPQMSQKLDQMLSKYYSRYAFDTDWPKDIENFLILIRLVPFKSGARTLASAETFRNSIKRLLVFTNVLHSSCLIRVLFFKYGLRIFCFEKVFFWAVLGCFWFSLLLFFCWSPNSKKFLQLMVFFRIFKESLSRNQPPNGKTSKHTAIYSCERRIKGIDWSFLYNGGQ